MKKISQSGIANIGIILLIILLAVIGGYTYLQGSKLKTPPPLNLQKDVIQQDDTAESTKDVINVTSLNFQTPQLIKEFNENETTYLFYKVGIVTEGKYKDYEIIKGVFSTTAGPCKGSGCGKPIFVRYLKKDNNLIFLPQVSELNSIDQWAYNTTLIKEWSFATDESLVLESLQEVKEMVYGNGKIEYIGQEEGLLNNKLYELFSDTQLGTVYTTKPQYSPQEPFYSGEETPYYTTGKWGDGKASCYSEECYLSNALYKFNADGTYFIYKYLPSETTDSLKIGKSTFSINDNDGDYFYITRNGCSSNDADYISISNPENVSINDLAEIGSFTKTGKKIYFFKDLEHQYLKYFYDKYKLNYPVIEGMRWGEDKNLTFKNYENFTTQYPVLFFEDEFGRLIRLTKKEFVIPFACEPVIYLYPENESLIEVSIDTQSVKLLGADPNYENGWKVMAKPNGELKPVESSNTYPHLFWEGTLKYLPERKDGFVISKDDITKKFYEILPKLGLNSQETNDFVKAWSPNLADAPYYFVTFHNTDTINTYMPLTVNPQPQTSIRILLDYKPLNSVIDVAPFKYPSVPERQGFTLVEWGGIDR